MSVEEAVRQRLKVALETIMQFDDDQNFIALARARYVELTDATALCSAPTEKETTQ